MSQLAENAEIRRMAADDVGRVMQIAGGLPDAPQWPEKAYLDALDPKSTPRRIALVATCPPAALAGFAVACVLPPQGELETIAVGVEFQRQGLGRRLFDGLSGELRDAGVREVFLEVRASNRAALRFYRSLGFGQTGLRRGYYAEPVEDAVLMKLRLGQS